MIRDFIIFVPKFKCIVEIEKHYLIVLLKEEALSRKRGAEAIYLVYIGMSFVRY